VAVITKAFSEVDGTIAEASSVNRVIDDLYTLQAGNIDTSNIAASGINANSLQTSSVITRTINDNNVTLIKLDESDIQLFLESVGA